MADNEFANDIKRKLNRLRKGSFYAKELSAEYKERKDDAGDGCVPEDYVKVEGLRWFLKNYSGIIIDNWLFILGNDPEHGIKPFNEDFHLSEGLVFAYDAVGGIFSIDRLGHIKYFAPDTLEWEDMISEWNGHCTYYRFEDFLMWALTAKNINLWYENVRWKDWKNDAKGIAYGKAFVLYPFPASDQFNPESAKKSIVPLKEAIGIEMDLARQLGRNP